MADNDHKKGLTPEQIKRNEDAFNWKAGDIEILSPGDPTQDDDYGDETEAHAAHMPNERAQGMASMKIKMPGPVAANRRSVHRTQWAAQFAVASELCKRGYEVAWTTGNHPMVDLMVDEPLKARRSLST